MIKINDVLYDAIPVNAGDGTMNITFKNTELSLSEIEEIFKSNPKIEVVENDTVIATYYNKEIRSLTVKFSNGERNAVIYLAVTTVPDDVADTLNGYIDNLKVELSTVKEANDTLNTQIGTLKNDLGTVNKANASLNSKIDTLTGELSNVKDSAEVSDGAITELADIAANTQSSTAMLEDAIQDLGNTIGELYETIQTLINGPDKGSEDSSDSDSSGSSSTDTSTGETDTSSSSGDLSNTDDTVTEVSTDNDKTSEEVSDNSDTTTENATSDNEEVSNG